MKYVHAILLSVLLHRHLFPPHTTPYQPTNLELQQDLKHFFLSARSAHRQRDKEQINDSGLTVISKVFNGRDHNALEVMKAQNIQLCYIWRFSLLHMQTVTSL